MSEIIFSAVQPSGILTIGNYIGVLKQWKKLQIYYKKCIFCIADLHSMTVRNNKKISNSILDTLSLLLACDIYADKNIIFVQSHVLEHCQLSWILQCYSYMGELKRMSQFKERSINYSHNFNLGLLTYPVLMAADILLYQASIVPIGMDQKQHLELSKKIARRFNTIYGSVFTVPKEFIVDHSSRVMGLLNPLKKMSKSDVNLNNIITLLDNPILAKNKIYHAITDSDNPPKIRYDIVQKPGISNLLNIFSNIADISIIEIEKNFYNKKYSDLKIVLGDVVEKFLLCLQKKYLEYRKNEDYLYKILLEGANKAQSIAEVMLKKIYRILGMYIIK